MRWTSRPGWLLAWRVFHQHSKLAIAEHGGTPGPNGSSEQQPEMCGAGSWKVASRGCDAEIAIYQGFLQILDECLAVNVQGKTAWNSWAVVTKLRTKEQDERGLTVLRNIKDSARAWEERAPQSLFNSQGLKPETMKMTLIPSRDNVQKINIKIKHTISWNWKDTSHRK